MIKILTLYFENNNYYYDSIIFFLFGLVKK